MQALIGEMQLQTRIVFSFGISFRACFDYAWKLPAPASLLCMEQSFLSCYKQQNHFILQTWAHINFFVLSGLGTIICFTTKLVATCILHTKQLLCYKECTSFTSRKWATTYQLLSRISTKITVLLFAIYALHIHPYLSMLKLIKIHEYTCLGRLW